jgi:uncharacterized protein (DUF1684 family)
VEALELAGYRRAVADLYRRARAEAPEDPEGAWLRWRTARDDLLAAHPQSPVPSAARRTFAGMAFHPYDHRWRIEVEVVPVGSGTASGSEVPHSGAVASEWRPVGEVSVCWPTGTGVLRVLWLTTYGGGLFVPFRDATNGSSTYGGGRYLLDTVKGADLGTAQGSGDRLVLDANYAYHPSCAHDARWSCPLAPPENRLGFAVTAGELLPAHAG